MMYRTTFVRIFGNISSPRDVSNQSCFSLLQRWQLLVPYVYIEQTIEVFMIIHCKIQYVNTSGWNMYYIMSKYFFEIMYIEHCPYMLMCWVISHQKATYFTLNMTEIRYMGSNRIKSSFPMNNSVYCDSNSSYEFRLAYAPQSRFEVATRRALLFGASLRLAHSSFSALSFSLKTCDGNVGRYQNKDCASGVSRYKDIALPI